MLQYGDAMHPENPALDNSDVREILDKLKELENKIEGQQHLYKTVLTHAEAAKYLNLSVSYLHKLTSRRQIPYTQPFGKLKYYDRQKLDAILLKNNFPSMDEVLSRY